MRTLARALGAALGQSHQEAFAVPGTPHSQGEARLETESCRVQDTVSFLGRLTQTQGSWVI